MEENSEFKLYKKISLRDDPSANCLWINGTLLHLPIDHRYGESIRVNFIENSFSKERENYSFRFSLIDLVQKCLICNYSTVNFPKSIVFFPVDVFSSIIPKIISILIDNPAQDTNLVIYFLLRLIFIGGKDELYHHKYK